MTSHLFPKTTFSLSKNKYHKLKNSFKTKLFHNAPVTLGSDYRTILKSDPILLILKSELDVPILKIDKFVVTILRFIGADFTRKMRQCFVLRLS